MSGDSTPQGNPADTAALQEQVEKLTELAARSQADLQNYKSRMEKESKDMGKFANVPLLMSLLPIRDDLARAAEHEDGANQILGKLDKVLADAGCTMIESKGQRLDASKHEVLTTAPGEKDHILEVHEEGFELHGKVLRPAKVVVGNGQE